MLLFFWPMHHLLESVIIRTMCTIHGCLIGEYLESPPTKKNVNDVYFIDQCFYLIGCMNFIVEVFYVCTGLPI